MKYFVTITEDYNNTLIKRAVRRMLDELEELDKRNNPADAERREMLVASLEPYRRWGYCDEPTERRNHA